MTKTNQPKHYAAIDIGSNAVRLLIKSYLPDSEQPLAKVLLLRVPIRLGEDSFSRGLIGPEKELALIRLMKSYKHLLKIYGVERYRACATSAMRDASNRASIIKKVRKKTGIAIELLSGEEEARLAADQHLQGIVADAANYLYVDVGGGSTELSLYSGGSLQSSQSFDIGTLRLLAATVHAETLTAFRAHAISLAQRYTDTIIIGTGGNINKLARLGKSAKNEAGMPRLSVEALKAIYHDLKALSKEERMQRYSLRADRADVIIPAAEIFIELADILAAKAVLVPIIGISDAIIDQLALRDRE